MFPIFIRLVDELLWTMHTMWPRGFPQTWKLLRKIWKQASIKVTQCGKTNMENGIHNELWTCSSQPNIIFALWKVLFSLKFWRNVDSKMKASFDIWIRYDPWCRIPTAKKILVITTMFFVFVCLKKQKYINLYLAAFDSWHIKWETRNYVRLHFRRNQSLFSQLGHQTMQIQGRLLSI